jgi:hypothetical protein
MTSQSGSPVYGSATREPWDLFRLPLLGAAMKRRPTRTALRSVVAAVAAIMVYHGLFGSQFAPKNLATVLAWVHYRGLLVILLLAGGNFLCMTCPLILARDLVRRLHAPSAYWPKRLRNKWLACGLFVLILFSYELFDLWSIPWWTAWMIVGFFAAAVVVDVTFKGASFCKFVCPIGQFNFVAATLSPLEVRVRDASTCASCKTQDCIRGRAAEPSSVAYRGCELALFQPRKVGNTDCTFCLDCAYACPHDNIGVLTRLPGRELWNDARASGVGRLARRRDISAFCVLFTFGGLLSAFGMVSPVYSVQMWLARALGTTHEYPTLGSLFVVALVIEPIVLLGAAGIITRRSIGARVSLSELITRYAFCLVPIGCAIWLAHYAFHLLTGLLSFLPALQQLLVEIGFVSPGGLVWAVRGLAPATLLPLQIGVLFVGAVGSIAVAHRIAQREKTERVWAAFAPWAVLTLLVFTSALWLVFQPMEMRGTFLAG